MRGERLNLESAPAQRARRCGADALEACCAMQPLAALPGGGAVGLACNGARQLPSRPEAGETQLQAWVRRWAVPLLAALAVGGTIAWSAAFPGRSSHLEAVQARAEPLERPQLPREWVFELEAIDLDPMFGERIPER